MQRFGFAGAPGLIEDQPGAPEIRGGKCIDLLRLAVRLLSR